MTPALFSHKDYKEYLRAAIESAQPKHGFITRLAEAASCQRSYLSQVIHGNAELTPDHALGLANFLKLNEKETDYFLLLVDHARAATPSLRDRTNKQLERIRKEQSNLANRVAARTVEVSAPEARYYSSWHWMAIHILSSVPAFRTRAAIAQRLGLPEPVVQAALEQLGKMGYIQKKGNQWSYAGGNLHLSRESPSIVQHHNNWRQRAVLNASMVDEESVHYTSVFTLSVRDFELLREKVLKWIDESRALIGPSDSEELACFCLDLFRG
jgi:uncharacterized protein (TIGR02147 family)